MKIWLWVGVPAVATSLGVGLLLARRSVRPVRLINDQLKSLTPATLRGGIISPENDPVLADLVEHINSSLARAGTAYEEMAGFSSRVAHELRTPLTLLRMKIEQSTGEMPAEMQEELQDELARLSRFVERSLLAAKAESGSLEPSGSQVDVSKMLEDIGEGYTLLAAEKNLQINWQNAEGTHSLHRCRSPQAGDAQFARQRPALRPLQSRSPRHRPMTGSPCSGFPTTAIPGPWPPPASASDCASCAASAPAPECNS